MDVINGWSILCLSFSLSLACWFESVSTGSLAKYNPHFVFLQDHALKCSCPWEENSDTEESLTVPNLNRLPLPSRLWDAPRVPRYRLNFPLCRRSAALRLEKRSVAHAGKSSFSSSSSVHLISPLTVPRSSGGITWCFESAPLWSVTERYFCEEIPVNVMI